jgi:hypothetical protein
MLLLASMAATFLFTGAPNLAFGEEYRVVSEEDFPHWKPGIGACEIAPGDDRCTLRAAIMEANARPGKDRIIVPSGTYLLSTAAIVDDHAIFGDLDITDDLVIEGAGVGATILDGNDRDRVFDVHGVRVELSGLSLRNGNTVEVGEPGGAVRSSGHLSLTRIDISASKGNVDGLCVRAPRGKSPVERCDVIGDDGEIASTGSLKLRDVQVNGRPADRPGVSR